MKVATKNEISEDFDFFSEDLDFDSSDLEDEHYKSVKRQKENEKKLKKKKKKIEKDQFFNEIKLAKVNEDEGRKITYEMLKNKGLTRKRKKVDRNSRVKLRMKFGKSMNKLKSKGIYLRKREKVYQGELTGINAGLIKGVSLTSAK
jgi:U3 small nucleolar RNA-associated protein 3